MGILYSCPFSQQSDLEGGLESIIVRSISFGDDEAKTQLRSVSFNLRNSEPAIIRSLDSGKMTVEGSISFKRKDSETVVSIMTPRNTEVVSDKRTEMASSSPRVYSSVKTVKETPLLESDSPKHEAAVTLQKVYKSFRTRRKLADCAVLVEQSWWKLLDYAELKRSSVSFFEIEKNETAISRWSRARTRAAKVGKGLSKDGKAQKLALQHWLEAIDPRHRYGHNLHFYFDKWLHCQSREPFFYWLDVGEGKEVNLADKCPRSKLQRQCIKYLGPMERKAFEVVLEDGKFMFKKTREVLHTSGEGTDVKWIFVLSTSKKLYVGKKKKGTFQHSSFLSGGATSAAGRLAVENGILKAVWPHSGHYRPTEQNFKDFISFLNENNVDLTDVKMSPVDEEEDLLTKKRCSHHVRNDSSEEDLAQDLNELEINFLPLKQEKMNSVELETAASPERSIIRKFRSLNGRPTNLKKLNAESFERLEREELIPGPSCNNFSVEAPADDHETEQEALAKRKLFDEDNEVQDIPQESILERINSYKGMKSYQLGKQLSFKWTTGAGPRIGCVRDYPLGLQSRALEQVSLSPRSAGPSRSLSSRRSC